MYLFWKYRMHRFLWNNKPKITNSSPCKATCLHNDCKISISSLSKKTSEKQILPFFNSLRTQCALNSSNDFRIINLCFAIFRHFCEIGFQVLAQNSWKSLGMCEFSQYKSNAFWWYDVYSCFLFKLHCLCTARSTASLRWYSCHSSVYSRSTKT